MLRGIAKAGEGDQPEDRHGIVVALSNLSKALSAAETDSAFIAAAEATATLLRVTKVIVFIKQKNGEVIQGGSTGIADDAGLIAAACIVARDTLSAANPVIFSNTLAEHTSLGRSFSKSNIVSVLSVPMRVSQTNVGAIVAMSDVLRAFTPSDVEILHVVSSQAALAAWRAGVSATSAVEGQNDLILLAQRKIQELSLVNHVSNAVSSTLDLDEVLDIALEQSMLAVGANTGSLMLINEETHRLEIVASRGLAKKWTEHTSQKIGTGVAGWVAEHGESVLVTNAREDPRFHMTFFRDDITSAASVPLKEKGRVIGVLNVNTTLAGRIIDERDLELLETVANELATAIDNARLYARINRRTAQLDSLLGISRTITATLNLDEVLRRLSEEICKLFKLNTCVLLLIDDLSGRLRFGYGQGLKTRRKYVYYDLAAPLATWVAKAGKKLTIRDIGVSKSFATEISNNEQYHSALCFPLKNAGKLVGIAAGFTKDIRTWPKSQRDIIRPLSELAGVAVHNARVYRQKYRMAEILQQHLIPSNIPDIRGLEIGHKFLPAREVGGDYYDFLKVAPGRLGVVLADVSGSDVEAAEYTSMGKHVLRAYARGCDNPAQILEKTNDLICEDTRAEIFISLFYGIFDIENLKLRYANAGCERPILYRADSKTATALAADGILLGIRSGVNFDECEIDLHPGDVLAVFTDGLTEAGVEKRRLGNQAVMDMISANAHLDAQGIADAITDGLLEFVHGRVTDDVAMVIIKIAK